MAGEQKFNINRTASGSGLSVGGTQETITADAAWTFTKTIPAGSVNARITPGIIPTAAVVLYSIVMSQPGTILTNSTGSPSETLTMTANAEKIWATGDLTGAKFITHDLTDFYVSVPGATAATLKILIAWDSTPVLADV